MLKIIAIAAVTAVVVVLVVAAAKPNTFRIERSAKIHASPDAIFPLINDLHSHVAWSPWEKKDPDMTRVHSGASSGKGAVYEWDGDRNIGKGRMEISESATPSRIVLDMHFIAPFEARNTAEFTLEPRGDTTTVTWAMHGPQPFMTKVMRLFVDIDAMIGREFETGLGNLKALVEA